MQGVLPGFVILIVICFQRGLATEYSGNQDDTNSCSSGHCSIEDEGPCKDDEETKLYRWDPVKVCNFVLQNQKASKIYIYLQSKIILVLFVFRVFSVFNS